MELRSVHVKAIYTYSITAVKILPWKQNSDFNKVDKYVNDKLLQTSSINLQCSS